jgi:hypothetical protein
MTNTLILNVRKDKMCYNLNGRRKLNNVLKEPFNETEQIEPQPVPSITKRSTILDTSSPPWALAQSDLTASSMPVPIASTDEVFCDFGPSPTQSLCEWQNGCGELKWITGTGLSTNWLGGPPTDSTAGTLEGGYLLI